MKRKRKIKLFDIANNFVFLLIAVVCVYPFLYIFFQSVSDGYALVNGQVVFFPKGFNWEAYKYIFSNTSLNITQGFRNSAIYTLFGMLFALAMTFMLAFSLTRKTLKERFAIRKILVLSWVFEAGIIPTYILFSKLGFVDNPLAMIIPNAISTQYLIITISFLSGIPEELDDAAYIDGANTLQVLTRIYLPLSKAILATIGMFYAVMIWNQYLFPQIYLKNPNYYTIQQILKNVVISDDGGTRTFPTVLMNGSLINPQNLKAATVFMAMLPIVCVYPFVQKYFKSGILIGSVKG